MLRSIIANRLLKPKINIHLMNTCLRTTWTNNLKKLFGFTETNPKKYKKFEQMDENLRLVWIDMEMTGLDPIDHKIMEVACIITEGDLKIVAEMPPLVIHQSDVILKNMNAWCISHHGKSGLTEACRLSTTTLSEAETKLLKFLQVHTPEGKCPLAGNSVYMDRLFLARYMPKVDKHIHYRIVDVSSLKEICRRWTPVIYRETPKKELKHRALDDIRESISELQYYKKAIFQL